MALGKEIDEEKSIMKKIKIYQSFEEQESDEISFLASLSIEERLNLFLKLMKLSSAFKKTSLDTPKKKIEFTRYENTFKSF